MIRYLAIKNLAVIESASIEFEQTFNVLTGETGAGKSMLVGAVALLLGGRASQDLVRTGEDVASVEAEFETPDGAVLLVRREVSSQGRSRAFIDGQLVTTATLRARLAELVELHGQHEHQSLLDPATHIPLLDQIGGLDDLRADVAAAWDVVRQCETALERTTLDAGERASRLELIEFHLRELDQAALQAGEDDALGQQRDVLRHAGRLQTLCGEAYQLLYDDEHAALSTLGQVWRRVGNLAAIDPTFSGHADAKSAVKAELEDLALTLRDYQDRLDASPARLQEIEDRLALVERLKRKHGPTLADVLDKHVALRAEQDGLAVGPERKDAAERALAAARGRFLEAARRLSSRRGAAAATLVTAIERELGDLAMGQARFEVRLSADESPATWQPSGIDHGEFYLAPNVGEDPRPLARIASGGELSRIMLAMKTLNAEAQPGRTLVFDEVDAGIGGRTAAVVGEKLRRLGRGCQVLCVTRLPQIAALAPSHFVIDKTVRGPRTVTVVTRLDDRGREREIARMMAGEAAASESVLAGAKALIAQAKAKGESRPAGESERARLMARKFLIETYGCQMNVHDSERMAGLLEQAGFEATEADEDADLVVINTCSVREKAEEKLYTRLGHLKGLRLRTGRAPMVAVTGCVAQQEGAEMLRRSPLVDVVLGTQRVRMLPMLVAQAEGATEPLVDIHTPYDEPTFPFGLTRRDDPVKAYVTIVEGCNDYCTYCVVPYTRGHERMRAKAEILDEVRAIVASGRKEIQLLGQIVNHYQAPDDPRCDFPRLLAAVCDVPGVQRVRFASPHPRHCSARLIEAIRDLPQVCKHLHLPVQSGSTTVLKAMRRRHTRDEYLALVDRLRDALPNLQLSTDMIVGFPGEGEQDFADTLSLVDAVQYHSMFSFKSSPRPNTLAAQRMPDDVPEDEKTRRIMTLQARQKAIQQRLHQRAVGTTVEVLVDTASRRRSWELAGRTTGNTVVNFPGRAEWVGEFIAVTIERAGAFGVWGRPAGEADAHSQEATA